MRPRAAHTASAAYSAVSARQRSAPITSTRADAASPMANGPPSFDTPLGDTEERDELSQLRNEVARLREELRLERGWPLTTPEPYRAKSWCEYALLPLQRTGRVPLRQIGIEHGPVDVLLCLFLGAPGVAFGLALDDDTSGVSCRVRVLVAMESVVVATVSAFGDGFLIQRILWWDHRITAPAHGVIWIVLFAALTVNGRISNEIMLGLLVLGIATLLVFHARAYYITVRQDPVISRRLGRAFHLAATLLTTLLVVALAVTSP